MKFFISFLLIAILSFAACLYLDWWFVAVVAFLVLLFIPQKPLHAFFCGFLSIFVLWGALIFFISSRNEHLLADKMSVLILGKENALLLMVISALLGAVVAGLGALSAGFIRRTVNNN